MLSESDFELHSGSRALFGVGAIGRLPKRMKGGGVSKVLVVTDAGLVRAGVIGKVTDALGAAGIESAVFDGVGANPHKSHVDEGADRLRALGDAGVVAVGGGSSMDAAKAIALQGPNGGSIADFYPGCRPGVPGAALFAVPTTAGTGSETNMYGVITDPGLGRKLLIGHLSVQPAAVALDPQLTLGVPRVVTATCGMDVLTHAVEALTCKRSNPFTDAVALKAIAMTARWLPTAFDDGQNVEARSQMLVAAHLAGIAFTSSGLGICHAMGHPVSARLDAAHGQTLATLLPHVMRFNLDAVVDRYAQVGAAMNVAEAGADDRTNAERAIAAVEALSARVQTNRALSELGDARSMVATLVEDAFADVLMMATPRFPKPEDVKALYEAAL